MAFGDGNKHPVHGGFCYVPSCIVKTLRQAFLHEFLSIKLSFAN